MLRHPMFAGPLIAALLAGPAFAQKIPVPGEGSPERVSDVEVIGHIVKPTELPPPDLASLKVPPGFRIEKFAQDLGNSRVLAVGPDGSVYVTRREQGDVLMLKIGSDGLAAGDPVRVASRPDMHGIAFHDGKVYLVTVKEIFRGEILEDGTFGALAMIVGDLPDAGQHHNRMIRFGADGMMYVSVGSTCNEANEPDPENATILQLSPDGKKKRTIYASGLRNTIGFGWHPTTGEMWGMDHGIDWLGDDEQPEELNQIREGKRYGWPWHYADNRPNPHMDPAAGVEKSELVKTAVPMVMGYRAHSAPMQLSFYDAAQFPAEYRGDAFISMRGSWNRRPPSGYEIVRIRFRDGKPAGFEPFVTGFLTASGQHARPCGNAVARDGSLLFSDDRNGVIYRVSYPGAERAGGDRAARPLPPAEPKFKRPIAIESPETRTSAKLAIRSPAFIDGGPIPVAYSGYDQNASLPLDWEAGPSATASYVILMDDPDADSAELPVSHWVAWNVPAADATLRAGLQPARRLEDPKGLCQGTNYAGKIGYAGPKPPEGDPAHHYHVQVFAVDKTLELPIGAKRIDVLKAIEGHVLAAGEIVGTFARPAAPARP